MNVFLSVFIGIAFVGFLIWLVNSKAVRDVLSAGRAQLGELGTAAQNADPVAMMNQAIRDQQAALDKAVAELEDSGASVAILQDQVKEDLREVKLQENNLKNSLKDDPEDVGGMGAEYVMKLEAAKKRYEEDNTLFVNAQKLHADNIAKFRAAQTAITAAQERARNLGASIKSSETGAKIARIAKTFNVDVSGLDNKLAEVEKAARQVIARNNAVSTVQSELGVDVLAKAQEQERLRKAEAKTKLDEYRKQYGIQ